jgi:RHS repeat-associated protein
VYNLRFPGQYYMAETGLNYNTERDYDPHTGEYSESDPIGLKCGLNTYAYARQNALLYDDPAGLLSRKVRLYVCFYMQSRGMLLGLPGRQRLIIDAGRDRGTTRGFVPVRIISTRIHQ